ncbi:hypothetical protein [Hymenobacter crusticola]|uniref:Uncharacterized protein n=1 Tax=Hymenobacter crusticola TaxID=1770526 RepID=A0A243WCX7_9BACT|nr:hypothetical protein [Hymenobacter crusticola]OUJ72904.1 hypothetical protein BXP70_16515 [Hymenobacter crusticola]
MPEPTPSNHILRNNLLGLLVGAVLAGSLVRATGGTTVIVFVLCYLLQVLVNLALGYKYRGQNSGPYLLSALLVMLIGFGACSAMFFVN